MNLDELKALAEGATPGPWFWNRDRELCSQINLVIENLGYDGQFIDEYGSDAVYIASANPAVVLALIEVAMAAKAFDDALDGAAGNLETIAAGDVMSEALAKLEAL